MYLGMKFEETSSGSKITTLISIDPHGLIPTAIVNFVGNEIVKSRLQSYKTYFIDKKAPDGSDNGGVWPDDENMYERASAKKGYKSETRANKVLPLCRRRRYPLFSSP